MYSPTYGELKGYLEKELDLEDETFITPDEFLSYFNEGVDVVESNVHTLYEDYFLTKTFISVTNGTATYGFPSDIFAQKIRSLLYDDGSKKYEIRRIKKISEIPFIQSTEDLKYIITNDSVAGLKMEIHPTPTFTSSTFVTLWYLRNALRFTGDDDDVCDVPEFTQVIVQYVRWKCRAKEGHPDTESDYAKFKEMLVNMVDTLTARQPDEDTEILKDFSFYNDFDVGPYGGNY